MAKLAKIRADVLVVRQGLADSREKAKRYIMAGKIYNDHQERIDKPGEKLAETTELSLKGDDFPYVSRGGLKLLQAIEQFNLDFSNQIVLDIGSSTGGFTDVALQHGASLSYALDVGTNQLAWKLRSDERVIVMEQTNFRYTHPEDFKHGEPNIATIDVSFISLGLILPPLYHILASDGEVAALIKPQFEARRDKVGRKGLVRDKKVHKEIIEEVFEKANLAGFDVVNLSYSPITGGTGNIEFLMHLKPCQNQNPGVASTIHIDSVIDEAHELLANH